MDEQTAPRVVIDTEDIVLDIHIHLMITLILRAEKHLHPEIIIVQKAELKKLLGQNLVHQFIIRQRR